MLCGDVTHHMNIYYIKVLIKIHNYTSYLSCNYRCGIQDDRCV